MVNVPVLVVCPGAMVRVWGLLKEKSPATAGAMGSTDTVRVVSVVNALSSLAATVAALEFPLSLIIEDESTRFTSLQTGRLAVTVSTGLPGQLSLNIAPDGSVGRQDRLFLYKEIYLRLSSPLNKPAGTLLNLLEDR